MYEFKPINDSIYSDSVRVYIDDKFAKFYTLRARRPCYRLRGKPVTPEEAIRIIAKTDSFLSYDRGLKGSIENRFLRMNYFFGSRSYSCNGWVHPNGSIGQNSHSGIINPVLNEILEDIIPIAAEFPFLDMIIAVSVWDRDMFGDNGSEEFLKNLQMGIWIHDRTIEIVNAKSAAELYKEYDGLYDGTDKRIFFPEYYREFAMGLIGHDFLRKCLNVYGIDDVDGFIEEGGCREIEIDFCF